MPDIVVNIYDPFANSRDFNPFEDKQFRRLIILTDNYTATSPTLTYQLDGTARGPITGERISNGEYHFWLNGEIGREIMNMVITLVAAVDNTATIRYPMVEYDTRRRIR